MQSGNVAGNRVHLVRGQSTVECTFAIWVATSDHELAILPMQCLFYSNRAKYCCKTLPTTEFCKTGQYKKQSVR